MIHHLGYVHRLSAKQATFVWNNKDNKKMMREVCDLLRERDQLAQAARKEG
jgi:hypothetical protein